MSLSLIKLADWAFGKNDYEANNFFNEIFANKLKFSSDCKKRDIADFNNIDIDFVKKDYKFKSKEMVENLKTEIRTSYLNKKFSLRMNYWYIIKPIGYHGNDSYRDFFALYIPNADVFEDVKNALVNMSKPCFCCDYVQIIDMSDGKTSTIFIGGLNEPEPPCKEGCSHDWYWTVYNKDFLEIYFAECKKCGIKKSKVIGDNRNHLWNENHGWRYKQKSTLANIQETDSEEDQ